MILMRYNNLFIMIIIYLWLIHVTQYNYFGMFGVSGRERF